MRSDVPPAETSRDEVAVEHSGAPSPRHRRRRSPRIQATNEGSPSSGARQVRAARQPECLAAVGEHRAMRLVGGVNDIEAKTVALAGRQSCGSGPRRRPDARSSLLGRFLRRGVFFAGLASTFPSGLLRPPGFEAFFATAFACLLVAGSLFLAAWSASALPPCRRHRPSWGSPSTWWGLGSFVSALFRARPSSWRPPPSWLSACQSCAWSCPQPGP